MKTTPGYHRSKGLYLKPFHKSLCGQLANIFKGDNNQEVDPNDVQSLLEMWENDGSLSDGTCMTMREYARTLIQPYISKEISKRKAPSADFFWEAFEDMLKEYMGEYYYNKI